MSNIQDPAVIFAAADDADNLRPWIDIIGDAIGVEILFASDQTYLSDFGPWGESQVTKQAWAEDLARKLGVEPFPYNGTSILALARKIIESRLH